MLPQRSFRSTLLNSLLCLSICQTIDAQTGVFSITDISTNTSIDLYKMYNTNILAVPGIDAQFSWDISNEQGPINRAFSTFNSSVELMAGPAEEASNAVVDVAATNLNLFFGPAGYYYPASLPLGLYHARINTTVNTTRQGESKIQQLTARTATINVTTSSPIGCGPRKPAPYTNVPSPSDPKFSSIWIIRPSAGSNVDREPDANLGGGSVMFVQWEYRDQRNAQSKGVTNVTVQILDSTTSLPVGPVIVSNSTGNNVRVKFTEVPMKLGGSYKVELKYRNKFPDGAVRPGDVVTFTSQDFNVVLFQDKQNNCANVKFDESPGKPNNGVGQLSTEFYHIAWVGGLALVTSYLL